MVLSAVCSDGPSTVELSILRRGMTGITSPQEKEEQKSPICEIGPPVFLLNGVGYFVAALAFPTSATTPSCCIKPRASQLTQPSTILPFVKRAMLVPEMVNCFPVGAIPLRSPLCVPLRDLAQIRASKSHGESSSLQRARLLPADCPCSNRLRINDGQHFCLRQT